MNSRAVEWLQAGTCGIENRMAAAFKMAVMMADLRLKHSKVGLYMTPYKGKISGY
ncbi:hypothetical protein [Thermoanaerobacterium sp. DL9XJH110]|uniref:hypothetical protein n=1 Tax=Thermoanaerobacterium sp. DL9XJH110 TaxID=3386643 RepID=UPI003BB6ABE8